MSEETNTAVMPETPAAPPVPPQKPKGKKRRRGHPVRNTIIIVAVIAALAVGGFFLFQFLNQKEAVNSQMQTAVATWSSIESSVQGSGSARAKESAAITLQNAGIVQYVHVTEGQMVMAGDPLYEIVSPAAQEAYDAAVAGVTKAQENVQQQYKALETLQQSLQTVQQEYQKLLSDQRQSNLDRFVKAPFAGQLQETQRLQVGTDLSQGTKIATLVDDSKFRASFYFSYAYEGQIAVGQQATVSVNGATLTGTVEEVNMVRRVSPEGSLLFEAAIVVPNPGALTRGLTATASLTAADGTAIFPYDSGTLEYYRTADILTKTTGTILSTELMDYADVSQGQTILTLSEEDFSQRLEDKNRQIADVQEQIKTQGEAITAAQEAVTTAEEGVVEAQKALEDFAAVAPISGTITSCMLSEGQEVKSGDTVITISNNATMVVTIQVDDRNIAYVKPGMQVQLTSGYNGGMFYGTVTKIDMSLSGDSMGSGMTNYPVTLEVDNFDGSLLEGMWLSYSFVTSQSDNCIVVPMQAVQYVSLADGETASAVFIQADSRPENALDVDIPEVMPGETPKFPSESEGFYAVPVTTGLSDNYNVEITEGLNGDETVFVAYYVEQAWG